MFNDQGDLILADLSPEGYKEIDRAHILDPVGFARGRDIVWSHPAFAQRACSPATTRKSCAYRWPPRVDGIPDHACERDLIGVVAMLQMLLTVAALLACAFKARAEDANAADLAKMQGDWMVATMTVDGMKLSPDEAQTLFRTIEGEHYTVSRYSKVIGRGTFKLDATQSPKTIDSTPAVAGDPSKPIRGIYEFDGDRLRVCNARPGQPRPKNFTTKMFTGHSLIEWQPEVK